LTPVLADLLAHMRATVDALVSRRRARRLAQAETPLIGEPTTPTRQRGGPVLQAPEDGDTSVPSGLPVDGKISSAFGIRLHPITHQWRAHRGTDLAAPAGSPVRATATGVVTQAGYAGDSGLMVTLDHGMYRTKYAHLASCAVAVGDQVSRDAVIGAVGSSGASTGSHLHYSVERRC
jgi:murein DD-endopeptidase MepM/ murein hydrolase activator NlpD